MKEGIKFLFTTLRICFSQLLNAYRVKNLERFNIIDSKETYFSQFKNWETCGSIQKAYIICLMKTEKYVARGIARTPFSLHYIRIYAPTNVHTQPIEQLESLMNFSIYNTHIGCRIVGCRM